MKNSKYYQIGYGTGQDIANCNKANYDLTTDENRDKFLSDMLETESDHYRQFSPFEFLAQEMNRGNSDGKWTDYENGVRAGIQNVINTESTNE